MIRDKILLIYSMIIEELNMKPFTKQMKKPRERGLKY